jgi:hypothetical protein
VFEQEFKKILNLFHVTPSTCYPEYSKIAEKMFSTGFVWWEFIALLSFTAVLTKRCVRDKLTERLNDISQWLHIFLQMNLVYVIDQNGGLDAFA